MCYRFTALAQNKPAVILIVLIVAFILPLSAVAQDPSEVKLTTYITPDNTLSLQYPEDWYITLDDTQSLVPVNVIMLADGDLQSPDFFESESALLVLIVPPSDFNQVSDLDELPSNPRELIELAVFAPDADMYGEIEEITLNDHPAVYATIDNVSVSGQIIVIDLGEGDFAVVLAFSLTGDYGQHQETVFSIVESMGFVPPTPIELQTVESEAMDISFELPADYVYDDSFTPGMIYFGTSDDVINSPAPATGEFSGFLADERFIAIELGLDEVDLGSPEDVLNVFAEILMGRKSVELETIEVEDAAIAEIIRLSSERPDSDIIVMAFEVPDKGMMVAVFLMNSGELADLDDLVTQIVTSIRPFNAAPSDTDSDG